MSPCSAIFGLCLLASTPSVVEGHPTAYDGDTLYFTDRSVRLFGIDAEEMDETNGRAARDTLRSLLRTAGRVMCVSVGQPSHGRFVGICHTASPNEGLSLNASMVFMGRALDCARYSNGRFASLEPAGVRERLRQKPYCNKGA